MRVPRPHFLSALCYRRAGGPEQGVGVPGLTSWQVAPAAVLEANDDVRDLQVPLLLQVGQHAGLEENLAQANVVYIAAELQSFDPEDESWLLTMGPPWSPGARPRLGEGPGAGVGPDDQWAASSW